MIPENAEEDLVAVSDLADVRAVSTTEVDATTAARESLVAFKFGGSSLLGAGSSWPPVHAGGSLAGKDSREASSTSSSRLGGTATGVGSGVGSFLGAADF